MARLRYGVVTLAYRYLPLAELLPRPTIQGLRSRHLGVSTQVTDRPIPADLCKELKHGPQRTLLPEQLLKAGQSHLRAPCYIKP